MKKLFVMTGIACIALFAQGAAVDWGIDKNSTDMTKKATIYAFLASDSANVSSVLSALTSLDNFETDLANKGVTYSAGYSKATGSSKGAATGSLSDSNIADNSDIAMMLVVFDEAGANYTTVSGVTGHSYSAETVGSASTADFSSSFGSASWTALGGSSQGDIPEPTSGLLLLVGAGMLALRRKQK